jgi:hypothetical protein
MKVLKFQELFSAIENSGGDEIRLAYNVASVLTGDPVEKFQQMKWFDFVELNKKLDIPSVGDFRDEWVKEIHIDGEVFFVDQKPTDWNGNTFFNMSSVTKEKNSIITNLHLILASCCYKEWGEDISLTEFERRSLLFQEKVDIDIAYPIGFFFAALLAGLSIVTQHSSGKYKVNRWKLWKLMRLLKRVGSKKNGVGMQR